MSEDKIRQIVRDEIEKALIKERADNKRSLLNGFTNGLEIVRESFQANSDGILQEQI